MTSRRPWRQSRLLLELLENDLEPGASNHLISIIQRQAERLQTYVQDLSDYFRYEMGTIILHPQTVDLTDLIRAFCVDSRRVTGTTSWMCCCLRRLSW